RRGGGDIHDRAAALRDHLRRGQARERRGCAQVHGQDAVERGPLELEQRLARRRPSGVVDQHVDAAEVRQPGGRQLLRRLFGGEIDQYDQRTGRIEAGEPPRLFQLGEGTGGERERIPLTRQRKRDRAADSASGAGYQCDPLPLLFGHDFTTTAPYADSRGESQLAPMVRLPQTVIDTAAGDTRTRGGARWRGRHQSMNPQVFREYDIRGIVERDFDDDFVVSLGRAYSTMLKRAG